MDMNNVLSKINEIEAALVELKESLTKELKPVRLAFVNFFAGGKSYAYTAGDDIAEGDLVMVPTASRGDIPGVVVYVENYTKDTVPFHDTKTVIAKLQDMDIPAAKLIAAANALAPAIAAKEESKSRLLAFLERRSHALAGDGFDDDDANLVPVEDADDNIDGEWDEGDEE